MFCTVVLYPRVDLLLLDFCLLLEGGDILKAVGQESLGSLRVPAPQVVDAHDQPLSFGLDHVPEHNHKLQNNNNKILNLKIHSRICENERWTSENHHRTRKTHNRIKEN